MFEQAIRIRIEILQSNIESVKLDMKVNSQNKFMMETWETDIEKYEYAIDMLNGVLNAVALGTRF